MVYDNDRDKKVRTPLDPTDDLGTMIGDTSGLSGVSNDHNSYDDPPKDTGRASSTQSEYKRAVSRDIPSVASESKVDVADTPPEATPGSMSTGNKTLDEGLPPHVTGEQGVNATNPDPASDDDTLANAHNVGLRLDEDEEHPQELDIGSDIDKAEEYHHSH